MTRASAGARGATAKSHSRSTAFHQVPRVGLPGQTVVWGYMEGLRVETPRGPLGQAALGRVGSGGGLGRFAGCQGRMHMDGGGKDAPRGRRTASMDGKLDPL